MADLKKIKYMYDKAVEEKDLIKPIYNSIYELTDPFYTIKDEGKQELGTQRDIVDSDVVSSIDVLVSYIMSTILPKGSQWASLSVDEFRMKQMFGDRADNSIKEINEYLPQDINTTFEYIDTSNYYEEIVKSVTSFVRVGTGAYAIRETGITSKPYVFEYVGLDNLFILNDSFSEPNIVFKKHPDVNGEYLLDMFGKDIKMPEGMSDGEYDKESTVFECVIPMYDEQKAITTYNYVITDEGMTEVLLEKELEYNPFVIFRFSTEETTPWGISIVVKQKKLLEEIRDWKTIFKKQATNIANPPKGFIGNVELFNSLSMEDGAMNYFGDPQYGQSVPAIQTIGGNGSLMPLDKLIESNVNKFKESLMVSHLTMNALDSKYNSATAIQIINDMFRQRFANTYELINSELVEPTFLAPFIILLKNNLLNLTPEVLPYVGVKFVSALTKTDNLQKVNKIVSYMNTIYNIQNLNKAGVLINLPTAIETIQQLMEINAISPDLVPPKEVVEEYQEAQRQMALQMQQQQAMAQMQGGMTDGQEISGTSEEVPQQ